MGQVLYTKFSSERAPEFAIRTSIVQEEDGNRVRYQEAEYPAGEAHLQQMVKSTEALEVVWENTPFQINCGVETGKRIKMECLTGGTLEEELDGLLEQGELETAQARMLEVLEKIRTTANCIFSMTSEFEKIFGEEEALEGTHAVNPANIELIFSNILPQEGSMHVVDSEWTFFFPIPVDFIIYRALHSYLKSTCDWYEKAGITPQQQEVYRRMEVRFQAYIRGDYASQEMLYPVMGKAASSLGEVLEEPQKDLEKHRMQIYLNDGTGFCEEHSYFVEQGQKEQMTEHISIPEGTKGIWIDPVLCDCMLHQVQLVWGSGMQASYQTNGYELERGSFLFDHSDPKLMINRIPQGEHELDVSYHISVLEHSMAQLLMDKVNTTGRIKKKIRGLVKE